MNYQQARQRESDQRWDYTNQNDDLVYAVGYCAGFPPSDPGLVPPEIWNKHLALVEPFRNKFHTDGHVTPEEANECYKQYLLDITLNLDDSKFADWVSCEVCGRLTKGLAIVTERKFKLCDEHRTREEIEKLLTVGEMITS